MLDFAMFAAVIVIAAFGIIGGLYLLFRHSRPWHDRKRKKIMMSNLK
jgi:hypothetical protein